MLASNQLICLALICLLHPCFPLLETCSMRYCPFVIFFVIFSFCWLCGANIFYSFVFYIQKKPSTNHFFITQNALERIPQSPVPTSHLQWPMGDNSCIQQGIVGIKLKTCEEGERMFPKLLCFKFTVPSRHSGSLCRRPQFNSAFTFCFPVTTQRHEHLAKCNLQLSILQHGHHFRGSKNLMDFSLQMSECSVCVGIKVIFCFS